MIKILTYTGRALIILLLLVMLYLMAAVVGWMIPVNKANEGTTGDLAVYLRTNGVHTSLILPAKTPEKDWYDLVNPELTVSGKEDFRYVSFGWGDLEFYRNTPQWSDLSFSIAFQALFLKSPSALHIHFYDRVKEDEDTFSIQVTREEYHDLVVYIEESFDYDETGNPRPVPDLHYSEIDLFYRANRSMHLFYTCNTWTNNALKQAGLRAALWTPFDKGIFFQYR